MSGTETGGKKAGQTNKAKYGEDFYKVIGKKGAEAYMAKPDRKPRGFSIISPEQRAAWGRVGGSRRKGWRKNG